LNVYAAWLITYVSISFVPAVIYIDRLHDDWHNGLGVSWWRVAMTPFSLMYLVAACIVSVGGWVYENHRRLKAITVPPPAPPPCRCTGGTNPCPLPPNDRPNQGMLT
jgi:hypothetical protein